MSKQNKGWAILLITAAILAAVFAAGRHGWRLAGFRACEGAAITAVEVHETAVEIEGIYPGSFPTGFCGYYAEEQDGTLYVGIHFSAVFAFWDDGDFAITIPVAGDIDKVILKSAQEERIIWNDPGSETEEMT